jgi:hypothetical protein
MADVVIHVVVNIVIHVVVEVVAEIGIMLHSQVVIHRHVVIKGEVVVYVEVMIHADVVIEVNVDVGVRAHISACIMVLFEADELHSGQTEESQERERKRQVVPGSGKSQQFSKSLHVTLRRRQQ